MPAPSLSLQAQFCDAAGNPISPLIGLARGRVWLTQLDRFDASEGEIEGSERRNFRALQPWRTIKFIESDAQGTRVVSWNVITKPRYQVQDAGDTIALTIPNVTEQARLSTVGTFARAAALSTIVQQIGAKRHGWSARVTDTGPVVPSAAPVVWTSLAGATATGNSIAKNAATFGWDAGALSAQVAASGNCAVQFQPASAKTDTACGLTANSGSSYYGYAAFALYCDHAGQVHVVENGIDSGPLGPYVTGDILSVSIENGVVYYRRNGGLIRQSGAAPVYPLRAFANLYTPAQQLDPNTLIPTATINNVIFTTLVAPADIWYAIRLADTTMLGSLTQLAPALFKHVRQGRDAAGNPARAFEVGAFGAVSGMRLVSAVNRDADAIARNNPNARVIKTLARDYDGSEVVNVCTPRGAGTGDTQVTLRQCWGVVFDAPRALEDPTKPAGPSNPPHAGDPNWGKYGNVPGSVFPEYDPVNYPLLAVEDPIFAAAGFHGIMRPARLAPGGGLEVAATDDGDYTYDVLDQQSYNFWNTLNPGEGEMRGDFTQAQFSYVDQNPSNQLLVSRALYGAAIAEMKWKSQIHTTLTVVTNHGGRVPPAGDLVHVDYKPATTDGQGVLTDVAIAGDFKILGVECDYGGGTDAAFETWHLSDKGFQPQDGASREAARDRQLSLVQLVPTTSVSTSVDGPTYRDVDPNHPWIYSFIIPPTAYSVQSALFSFELFPLRQTATVADNPAGTPISFTIPHGSHTLDGTWQQDGTLKTSSDGFATDLFVHIYGVNSNTSNVGVSYVPGLPVGNAQIGAVGNADYEVPVFRQKQATGPGLNVATTATSHTVPLKSGVLTETDLTATLPQHQHPLTPGISEQGSGPGPLFLEIDPGDGVFVDRTVALGGPWSQSTGVMELAPYLKASIGKKVRFRFRPSTYGAVGVNRTLVIEQSGTGSKVLTTTA